MADHVIDTNVLYVASHADPSSPWEGSEHVPAGQRRIVFEWVRAFRADDGRRMVLDRQRKIVDEYKRKNKPPPRMTDQDYGMRVWLHKHERQLEALVDVAYDPDNHAVVPEGLARFDPSDKKMVAAHLRHEADGNECAIVNACDTDWVEHEKLLEAHKVKVRHLLREWCLEKLYEKYPDRAPPGFKPTDWANDRRAARDSAAPRKGK